MITWSLWVVLLSWGFNTIVAIGVLFSIGDKTKMNITFICYYTLSFIVLIPAPFVLLDYLI